MTALGQTPQVTHVLEWTEVRVGTHVPVQTPNGTLEPGEAARISISASFTPPVGTPVAYQNPAPGGVAPVAGLSASAFHLLATGAGGEWSDVLYRHGFGSSFPPFPDPSGTLLYCGFGQPSPAPGSWPISMNPLPNVWEAVWTPASYEPRLAGFEQQQVFSIPANHPRLLVITGLDPNGNPRLGEAFATGVYGSVQIPIVPAPAAAVVLCLGLGAAARRERRG